MILENPTVGSTCKALSNENYEYHLSGDARKYCVCAITKLECKGRIIHDPKENSSQFFSRGKCAIDTDTIKECPAYGLSKETFIDIMKSRADAEIASQFG